MRSNKWSYGVGCLMFLAILFLIALCVRCKTTYTFNPDKLMEIYESGWRSGYNRAVYFDSTYWTLDSTRIRKQFQ